MNSTILNSTLTERGDSGLSVEGQVIQIGAIQAELLSVENSLNTFARPGRSTWWTLTKTARAYLHALN